MLSAHPYSDVTRVTRLLKIITRLRQRQPAERIGRKRLAEEFECNPRTIQRDIELLQVYMHLPLTYDRAAKTYRLEGDATSFLSFTSIHLTAEEALALAVARELFTVSGFPLKGAVLAALDKAAAQLYQATAHLPASLQVSTALRKDLPQAAQTFQVDPLDRDYSQAPLAPLLDAARAKNTLEIYYQSRSSKQLTWRQVDPYEVALRNAQNWEMHGWCHTRRAIRTFALDKIVQMRSTSACFTRREQEWAEFQATEGVVGGLRGDAAVTVDVVFDACIAAYALDRQWPKTLRLTAQPDGSVRMTGTAQGTEGLVVELLSWRRHALVKGGPELRAQMQAEVQAIAARYKEE